MKFAWVEDNRVRDSVSQNPSTLFVAAIAANYNTQIPNDVQNGAELIDGEWVNPPPRPIPGPQLPPTPDSVTPRQARLVLALTPSGDENFPTMLAKVEAAFASLPEPEKTVAQITWEYSTEVQRNNPLIAQMQAVIGFTDEQIDQMFIQAATL